MRARLIASVLALVLLCPATASAARVRVLGRDGHVSVRQDPFLPAATLTPPPSLTPARARIRQASPPLASATARRRPKHRRPAATPAQRIATALRALARTGAISASTLSSDLATVRATALSVQRLRGTRSSELGAVLGTVAVMASHGRLTAARLPALMMTLARNRQWWSDGSLLGFGQRVEFQGSELVWEYYPGQGIQLQPLANFGKADGLYTAGAAHYAELAALLGELQALAVPRGGAPSWEYYFNWEGGRPPWTSAMAQGTALEALTRGYEALGDRAYLGLAHQALGLFKLAPPLGVAVPTAIGTRYVQYSFTPGTSILNAFLQSLIGLYDYAQVSGDAGAKALFAAGDAEAQAELPSFDTGAWSLYEPGQEDSLDYHELVTGFLSQLCSRTGAVPYCTEAQRFDSYLHTPPVLVLLTTRLRAGHPGTLRFSLSKQSHVGAVVSCAGHTVLYTSAWFAYGRDAFSLQVPTHARTCSVRLAASDLAGNFSRIQGSVSVR